MNSETEFHGAKLLLFLGGRMLVIKRDDKGDIPYPGFLDLVGGERDGDETPEACVIRECSEETALHLEPGDLSWRRPYQRPSGLLWLFAAHLDAAREADVELGEEGEVWKMMDPMDYALSADAVPHFKSMVLSYVNNPMTPPTA